MQALAQVWVSEDCSLCVLHVCVCGGGGGGGGCVWGYCQHTLQCPPLNSVPRCHSCHIQATRMHSPRQFPLYHLLHIVHVNERCRRKEERSKHWYTNNKAKQHNTPKAVTFPKKNELRWVGFKPTTLRALHQLNYRSRSSG